PPPPPLSSLSLHDALPISAPAQSASRFTRHFALGQYHAAFRLLQRRSSLAEPYPYRIVHRRCWVLRVRDLASRRVALARCCYHPDRKSTRLNSSHLGISYA